MARKYKGDKNWYMATDGESVFHVIGQLDTHRQLDTGQPYVIRGTSENNLYNKVFVNPQRNEEGKYIIEDLTPKNKKAIIKQDYKGNNPN